MNMPVSTTQEYFEHAMQIVEQVAGPEATVTDELADDFFDNANLIDITEIGRENHERLTLAMNGMFLTIGAHHDPLKAEQIKDKYPRAYEMVT